MLDVAALYAEYARQVGAYLCKRSYGQFTGDDIDDMVSMVFERACRAAQGYEDRGVPVGAWLFRIAHNLLIDERRRRPDRQTLPLEAALSVAVRDDAPTAEPLPLHILTHEQREVLAWRYERDLTMPEVGDVMGIGYEAAKQRHRRAILTLRRRLGAA